MKQPWQNVNFYDGDNCNFSWQSSNKPKGHSGFIVAKLFVAYVPPV